MSSPVSLPLVVGVWLREGCCPAETPRPWPDVKKPVPAPVGEPVLAEPTPHSSRDPGQRSGISISARASRTRRTTSPVGVSTTL